MNEIYSCKSGHETPIHVMLAPSFWLQEKYSMYDLVNANWKKMFLPKRLDFTASIENFNGFETLNPLWKRDCKWYMDETSWQNC